jgi:hypothetical protein
MRSEQHFIFNTTCKHLLYLISDIGKTPAYLSWYCFNFLAVILKTPAFVEEACVCLLVVLKPTRGGPHAHLSVLKLTCAKTSC